MPYSSVDKPNQYFDTSLWSGTGATQSISSLNFQPDWLWVKSRSTASNHRSQNAVTGVTKGMNPNQTNAEDTLTDCVTSFNSNGFTLGADSQGYVNTSSRTYVGWSWKGNGTGVSNTAGTISSTVSANTTSGFSIIKFTASGSGNQSVGHGLGVAPKMFITKATSSSSSWNVYHASLNSSSPQNYYLNLDLSNASSNLSGVFGAGMTSSVCGVGVGVGISSGVTYIGYAFAEIKGYSKFGSYTGNGSTDGTFVYTGFKPAFIMLKSSSSGAVGWITHDNKRIGFNPNNYYVEPNNSNAESADTDKILLLSNGFKLISTSASWNTSSGTYIYMAFAENPFVSSKGLPTTAR
jgi:hypothetical protein